MNYAAGALIAGIAPNGAAERGGLQRGDVILEIDGRSLANAKALVEAVSQLPPGKTITLQIFRGGYLQQFNVTLQPPPEPAPTPAGDNPSASQNTELEELLGIAVEPLADVARARLGLASQMTGLLVTRVRPGQQPLKIDDVILEVDQQPVASADDLVQRASAVKKNGRKSLLLTVSGPRGDTRFVAAPFVSAPAPAVKRDRE